VALRLGRLERWSLLAAGVACAACRYSFSNPVERLRAGEVSGRTLADPQDSGHFLPTGGISVSIQGSTFDQVTHDTGLFILIPLPVGEHTLLFRSGTTLSLVRHAEVALGRDGQREGVSLGDVVIPFAGAVGGTVSDTLHGGVVVDEATGQVAPIAGGAFRLEAVSLGDHRLKFGLVDYVGDEEWVGGPADLHLDAGASSSLTRLALVPVRPALGNGRLRVRLVSLEPAIAPVDIPLTITEALRGAIAPLPPPDAGGVVELALPEGIYEVGITPPAAFAGVIPAPLPATAVVLSSEVAEVGSLYLVPTATSHAAQVMCRVGDDCGRGGTCASGQCIDWAPPPAVPARVPLCNLRMDQSTGGPCVTDAGVDGIWVPAGSGFATCLACSTECTPDSLSLVQAPPLSPTGSCP